MEDERRLNRERFPKWAFVFSILGVILSSYALYVEYKHIQDSEYEALCDFTPQAPIFANASCSAVFASEAGRFFSYMNLVPKGSILDQPNSLYGIVTYLLISLLMFAGRRKILFAISVGSLIFSAFLAYDLFFVLKEFCIVCVSIYCCNIGIFLSVINQFRKARKARRASKEAERQSWKVKAEQAAAELQSWQEKAEKAAKGVKVVAHIHAVEGKEKELREVLESLVKPTRKEDGCLTYELFVDNDAEGKFTFVEEWTSPGALENHLKSAHFREASEKMGKIITKSAVPQQFPWIQKSKKLL